LRNDLVRRPTPRRAVSPILPGNLTPVCGSVTSSARSGWGRGGARRAAASRAGAKCLKRSPLRTWATLGASAAHVTECAQPLLLLGTEADRPCRPPRASIRPPSFERPPPTPPRHRASARRRMGSATVGAGGTLLRSAGSEERSYHSSPRVSFPSA